MASFFPPIYLLPTHLSPEARQELEDQIPSLTHDITEAKLILGKVATKQRARFELRSRKLWTEEVIQGIHVTSPSAVAERRPELSPTLRQRVNIEDGVGELLGSSTETESEATLEATSEATKKGPEPSREISRSHQSISPPPPATPPAVVSSPICSMPQTPAKPLTLPSEENMWGDTVQVVKLPWFYECLAVGCLVPFGDNLIYEGRLAQSVISAKQIIAKSSKKITDSPQYISPRKTLDRTVVDDSNVGSEPLPKRRWADRRKQHSYSAVTRPTRLFHQTSSEQDADEEFPPVPSFLKTIYSCERPTPLNPVNEGFIIQLKKIRKARELTDDRVGIRAYSSAIAAFSAYPYTLTSPQEIFGLPGCNQKIAAIYKEWKENNSIREVEDIESDPKMQILSMFYDIYGVGPIKARDFYCKGWKDLDDIVAHGWSALTHAQQIGLKYYDDFQSKIPRAEVERISNKIHEYANNLYPGFQMCIVGGYRRGKEESGDVDVILSHQDESITLGFVQEIVVALGSDGWIKHTLEISLANSRRNQTPVSWKGNTGAKMCGFDTLDKALVVWQDQRWPTKAEDLKNDQNAKNPAVLRRVDIIITPWKTAGCAVVGWSGGTTFQRDLRRYANKVRNLKFDSSGVRSRLNGLWVDLESEDGKRAPNLLIAEKRVFAGLGLEWREPWERCTG